MMWKWLMATPQCAMAQPGSFAATPVKAMAASRYANECKRETPRSKAF
jgi:hypothetical protein